MPKRQKRLSRKQKKQKFKTIRNWLESKRKKAAEDLNKEFYLSEQ